MGIGRVEAAASRTGPAEHLIAVLFPVVAAVDIVAARSTVFTLPALCIAVLILTYVERRSLRDFQKPVPASIPLALFLGFAAMSAVWSSDASTTLKSTLTAALTFLQWHVVNQWLANQPGERLRPVAFWFVIAALIGGLILLHEVWSNQLIRRLIDENFHLFELTKYTRVNKFGHMRIPSAELNRSIAVLNMFLWPSILCAASLWSGRKAKLIAVALVVSATLTTIGSNHETSKLALVAGLLCFAVAYWWHRAAVILVGSAWALLVLGCVIAAQLAYDPLELHKASWVQRSAQARFIIWHNTATNIAEAPILGAGVRTGYVEDERRKRGDVHAPAKQGGATIHRHAHNVYLQNWFELGFVGAALFLGAGLGTLCAITRLPEHTQPYALAAFSVFSMEIASSWELWQTWFMSLFALTAIYMALAIRSAEDGDAEAKASSRPLGHGVPP